MKFNIVNNTSYKKIGIVCNGKEYFPEKNKALVIDAFSENIELKVRIYDRHRVLFNFLYFLLDGFFDSENFVFDLYADAEFDLLLKSENQTVHLKNLNSRDDDNNIIYNSVYLYSDDIVIKNITFELSDTVKVRHKYWIVFLVLWLPAVIFAFFCLPAEETLSVFIGAVILLLFIFFTLRKNKRYKAVFNKDRASAFLYTKDDEFRQNDNEEAPYEPRGVIEKGLFKVLDKIFKTKDK